MAASLLVDIEIEIHTRTHTLPKKTRHNRGNLECAYLILFTYAGQHQTQHSHSTLHYCHTKLLHRAQRVCVVVVASVGSRSRGRNFDYLAHLLAQVLVFWLYTDVHSTHSTFRGWWPLIESIAATKSNSGVEVMAVVMSAKLFVLAKCATHTRHKKKTDKCWPNVRVVYHRLKQVESLSNTNTND